MLGLLCWEKKRQGTERLFQHLVDVSSTEYTENHQREPQERRRRKGRERKTKERAKSWEQTVKYWVMGNRAEADDKEKRNLSLIDLDQVRRGNEKRGNGEGRREKKEEAESEN